MDSAFQSPRDGNLWARVALIIAFSIALGCLISLWRGIPFGGGFFGYALGVNILAVVLSAAVMIVFRKEPDRGIMRATLTSILLSAFAFALIYAFA